MGIEVKSKEYFGKNHNSKFVEEFGIHIFEELKNCIYSSKNTKNIKLIRKNPLDKWKMSNDGYCLLNETIVISWADYVGEINIFEYGGYELLPDYLGIWKREVKINELLKKNQY